MTKSSFVDYVVSDLLAGFQGVRARAMFGGYGIYKDDTIFAIVVNEELYYKVGSLNREDFEEMGSEPFRYDGKGKKPVTMSYWKLPSEVMDDFGLLEEWTKRALAAAAEKRPPSK